jgi:hypothetical protein
MTRPGASLVLAILACACTANNGTTAGDRGQCATGGALNQCPPADQTAEGACWRMVDCAAIPLKSDNNNHFDWGNCVDAIEGAPDDSQRLIIACIAASECDALKVDGSPDDPDISKLPCAILVGGP